MDVLIATVHSFFQTEFAFLHARLAHLSRLLMEFRFVVPVSPIVLLVQIVLLKMDVLHVNLHSHFNTTIH